MDGIPGDRDMKIAEILTLIFIFSLVGVVAASWFRKTED
jgi:hypothetical protein